MSDKELSQAPSAKRQRLLRQRDSERGIKTLKLRCTTPESNLIDSVSAQMGLKRSEAAMALFVERADKEGVSHGCVKPKLSTIRLPKDSEAFSLLSGLSDRLGVSPAKVMLDALVEYNLSRLGLS